MTAPSSIVQTSILQFTPIVTLSPILISLVCCSFEDKSELINIVLSCIIVFAPIVILHVSPLKVTPW